MPSPRRRPLFARVYHRMAPAMDRQGAAEHRSRLLAGLVGDVVEVGAGGGANFAHYPEGVGTVLAIEPEPYLRDRAARTARDARTRVRVADATAERIPAADGSVDAVVACLVLCSVRDQATALREMFRVLRGGGQLRFYEHVAASTRPLLTVQRVADATAWPFFFGGCHTGRDTLAAIRSAGFAVEDADRFDFPSGYAHPAAPHVLGRATRP